MARNSDGHVLMLFALARIGAIMVPVNPEFGVEEARYVLHHAEVSGVVASAETLESRAAGDQGCREPRGFSCSTAATTRLRRCRACWRDARAAEPRQPGVAATTPASSSTPRARPGFPKGAMHSQRSFVTGGEAFVQRVHLQDDDRVMIVLPLFHMNALFYSVAGTLAAGCSMMIVPRFSASTFWQTAVEYGATEVNIIEAIGTILKTRPRSEFRPEHMPCARSTACATACRQDVPRRIQRSASHRRLTA